MSVLFSVLSPVFSGRVSLFFPGVARGMSYFGGLPRSLQTSSAFTPLPASISASASSISVLSSRVTLSVGQAIELRITHKASTCSSLNRSTRALTCSLATATAITPRSYYLG